LLGWASMEKRMSFAQSEDAGKKKVTRRERFLGEMEKGVPWARLCGVIVPHYPRGERGRPPIGTLADAAHLLSPAVVCVGG
jgi:transposase, IS5 family